MTIPSRTSLYCLLVITCCTSLRADEKNGIINQQKDLEGIRQQVEQGQKKLDSLQAEEQRVAKSIADYDQKISSDRKVINRLNREFRQLKSDLGTAEDRLNERTTQLERRQRRYLGSLRQFYFAASQKNIELTTQPNRELEKHRQIAYLHALAGFESQNIEQASHMLVQANGELEDLTGRSREVSQLKKTRETSVALESSKLSRQQKNLDQVKRTSREEFDHMLTLQKAAEEMESIVARLLEEQQKSQSGTRPPTTTALSTLKGQLPSPFRGRIIAEYGKHTDPVTKLKSFSPGITIKGKAGNNVRSVASGTVAYAGDLRGYGNFVIINHDNRYYSTYAGLGEISVAQGQFVQRQAALGKAASDGIVRFELRDRREPLDPVEWIRIESL